MRRIGKNTEESACLIFDGGNQNQTLFCKFNKYNSLAYIKIIKYLISCILVDKFNAIKS